METVWIKTMREGFGQLGGQTYIHPLALTAVIVLGILMIGVSRQWSVMPMLIIACFIPAAQRIVLFGIDFDLLRIMVLFGVTRLLIKKEYREFQWKKIDKVMLFYVASAALIYILQNRTFSIFINRLGFSFDVLGMYFLFRCLIRDWRDFDRIVLAINLIGISVAMFFLYELNTQRNLFSIFGGVPEFTHLREGKLRCQGAYSHPIIAGCFWVALLPLILSRWWNAQASKFLTVCGVLSALLIVAACHSSTPVFGVIAVGIGGIAFYARQSMRTIRWGVVIILTVLHFIMKRPVWGLLVMASSLGGGTGYHRFALIDGFIKRFGEWALLGTRSTAHWAWGGQDITNQYVLEGVKGGLITLVFFIALIVFGFRGIGQLCRSMQKDRSRLITAWAMGVCLFVHCMNFVGVSYFGQIYIIWYLILAMIGSMTPTESIPNRAYSVTRRKQLAPAIQRQVEKSYIQNDQ